MITPRGHYSAGHVSRRTTGWSGSDAVWMLRRVALVYVVLALCRTLFYIYNHESIGVLGCGELWSVIKGSLRFDTISVLYANLPFILLSLIPLRMRSRKWWRGMAFVVYMITNTVMVVAVNLADTVYFRYTAKRFTADEIFFAGNDNTAQLILKFMWENWYLVAAGLLMVWGLWVTYRRKAVPCTPIMHHTMYYIVNTLILAAAVWLSIGGIRGGFTRTTRPVTLNNVLEYTSSPGKANLILSNPFCIVRTMGNKGVRYETYFDRAEADAIFQPYHYPDANESNTFGSMEGRNIVIFILESFSAEHSALLMPSLHPDGRGYTPFLDSLMSEGLTFTDAYSNGGKSIEALSSVLASMPSFKRPFVLLPQSIGESRPLPAILGSKGYTTAFFCGSPAGSMGFDAYVSGAGVERLYAMEDFERERGDGYRDGYWGIWDMPFIDYVGGVLSSTPQPFMSTVFTVSSHHPFVVPDEYAHLPAGTTKIHKGVQYTDLSIRNFFDKYSSEEWFANTVFVFTADHVSSEKAAPQTQTLPGSNHIVQFVYTPGGELRGRYTEPVQQTDLMPTLLGLLGEREPYFAFGRDIFGEPERPAVALGFSSAGMIFYIANGDYLVLFDEKDITEVYRRSDTLMEYPLPRPYPTEALSLTKYLKAVIQQYDTHIKERQYVVPNS